jgi:hypothetical protein
MARKPDPERIYIAQRDGLTARLAVTIGRRVAERWIAAWEAEAAELGIEPTGGAFWAAGEAWIAERSAGPGR